MNKVKHYRTLRNITQEELARLTKITLRQIQKIENGQNTTIKSANKIK